MIEVDAAVTVPAGSFAGCIKTRDYSALNPVSLLRPKSGRPNTKGKNAMTMNTTTEARSHRCESCTMPIESGQYCQHCSDENGNLQPFDRRFERMVQWTMGRDGELSRGAAEKQTLDFMGTLPAWRNHPDYLARISRQE